MQGHRPANIVTKKPELSFRLGSFSFLVGLGTFAPVKTPDIRDHIMEEESYEVPADTQEAIEAACKRSDGRRGGLWAVGTTVIRTLETAFDGKGRCIHPSGKSRLFITPGYEFKLPYKGFITNFHLPRSTPLMLTSAFLDRELVLKAYEEAKEKGYRFYSLGDSMAIKRSG